MAKSLLAAVLLAVMAGAWAWALRPAVPVSSSARAGGAPSRHAQDVAPRVRLDRLATNAAPPLATASARDPFRRAAATPGPGATRPAARRPHDTEAPPPPRPLAVWPRVELIGIAEVREGDVLTRTAIVSGPRGVHHVRAGDVLEGVYRVEGVDQSALDLRLLPEDRALRLELRP